MKFDNILVPYDGSECAERAFNAALDLAKFTNSDIRLLTCVEPASTSDVGMGQEFVDDSEKKERARALDNMEKLVERGKKEGVKVEKDVEKAISTPKKIADLSGSSNVDVIVMGSHGRTGLNKFIFGSNTSKAAPLSECPIMIVK